MSESELCERITATEQSVKTAHHRIDEMVENSKNLAEIVAEVKYMRRDLNELIGRVSTVEEKPARRYDVIINAVLTAAIAAVVSFVMR